MSLREKLGQMLMVPFFGAFASSEGPEFKESLHEVEENHVGGLMISTRRGRRGIERSQVYATATLLNELQRRARIPLLVGADFESGTAMRLEEGTAFPSAMAIGATRDSRLAYAVGKAIAIEARAAGVHWIFAPDADVNNNPANPIINVRSFGENPPEVAAYVAEFVRGVEEHGALATAKHFPGHGNVSVDSHLALAVVRGNRAELEGTELVPFRAAIRARVSSIMPGHLAVPALDADADTPATISKKILTGLLRGEMKFRGLIITDALDMAGLAALYAPGEAAVRAVEAGADVLLMPPIPDAALAALEEAVGAGRIPIARIDASVRRILGAKARLGLARNSLVDAGRLPETFGRPEHAAQAQATADRGVTLLRNLAGLLPLDATRPLRVLLVALSGSPDSCPGETLEPDIRARAYSLDVLRADTNFSPLRNLGLPSPETYDVAIAALFVRVADRQGHVSLPQDHQALVNQLLATGKPAVVVSFGSPYLIENFPTAKTWLAVFSANSVSQRAAARALFGQVAVSGKIPVTVPGAVEHGAGLHMAASPMTLAPAPPAMARRLKPAYDVLTRGLGDGAFPGAALAVGCDNQLAIHACGKLAIGRSSPRVRPDTIYDVASLTKPIVTATAAMMLVEQERLDLDKPVEHYLPEFAAAAKADPDTTWRGRVTPRKLLLHESGLPWHRDFYKDARGARAVLARVLAEPLVREPGKQIEYSDVGFVLLGEIVQRLTGHALDEFARENIFQPLGMKDSLFNPLGPLGLQRPSESPKPPRGRGSLRGRIAPTENDTKYRKRLIRGEVDDENSWAMGGVAGHAGLFSTAGDIAVFAQMLLNGGSYAHHRLLSRSRIQEFTTRHAIGDSARALGWDVPTEPSSSGRYFSAASFGHTGFTGASLWIDPERKLFVVLLTNRVHPSRANEKIRQLRPALHDAVVEALGLAGKRAAAR